MASKRKGVGGGRTYPSREAAIAAAKRAAKRSRGPLFKAVEERDFRVIIERDLLAADRYAFQLNKPKQEPQHDPQ